MEAPAQRRTEGSSTEARLQQLVKMLVKNEEAGQLGSKAGGLPTENMERGPRKHNGAASENRRGSGAGSRSARGRPRWAAPQWPCPGSTWERRCGWLQQRWTAAPGGCAYSPQNHLCSSASQQFAWARCLHTGIRISGEGAQERVFVMYNPHPPSPPPPGGSTLWLMWKPSGLDTSMGLVPWVSRATSGHRAAKSLACNVKRICDTPVL